MPPWNPKKFSPYAKRDMVRKHHAEIVKLAKGGSLLALFVVSNQPSIVPGRLYAELFRIYCALLQHPAPLDPRLIAAKDGLEDEAVQRAGYCLHGLVGMLGLGELATFLGGDLAPLVAAWPGIFKWMVYL